MSLYVQDDQQLVKSYLNGCEASLEVLINRHKDRVYTAVYMFVRDKYLAEDIFQDTFIKVVESLRSGNYKEEGKFLPWVMRISHNLCIDYFRKVKRKPSIVDNEGFDIFEVLKFSGDNAEQTMIKDQAKAKVKDLINQLPDEQKEVVVLRHYAEMSFKEIADMTGVSINTALGRMRYALINLRKMVTEKSISL
ncbi:MAG: sigma-70 family RNA polymerase sigma factor [Bacteroidetes bacterium]|nr:sigma-70 family RNA polymerase sigma factor [Bacteroidota bacterium]